MVRKLIYLSLILVTLAGIIPFSAVPAAAAGTAYQWADELSQAITQENWDQAHNLARQVLKEQGYKKSGNQAVDWFIDGERLDILGKVQQETVQEIVAKNGEDALEGIINIGSHARWNNPKYIPGKSDMDFVFIGKNSTDADILFRLKLAEELGISDPTEALSLTKIGSSNDLQFNKLQQVKSMEEALQKGEQDVATFLQRLDNPEYAEYYKNFGADKYVENYNWQAGSYDRINVSDGSATIIRDPGTVSGSLKTAEIGADPTAAMQALYYDKGWKVPKMDMGDSWGLATNEYYFMQRDMEELAGASASEKAVKLAKRAERFNEALTLAQMDPPAEFVAQTRLLRQGGTLSDEAADVYLKELNRMSEVTLERTLKAKIMTDLNRSWQPEWLGGGLKDEALDATVKFAETRKFLETTFGMKLIGQEKARQLVNNLDVPGYFKNIISDEYGKALELAGDSEKLSKYISSQATRKVTIIQAAEEAGESANLKGFISGFLSSPGGRITLEGLDVGLRLFTVYDAYEQGGWNAAGQRLVLEGGAKWAAWQGISRADLALLVFDIGTMSIKAVGNAAMEEMRNDNVMGIYTGVIPQREAGWLFIGLKNDVKPNYTSLFDSLDIKGLSDDTRAKVRANLDGNQGFEKYIKDNVSWWEWAFGITNERREELKDIYVSLTNVNYMRGQLYESLRPDFEKKVKEWQDAHGKQSIYDEKNAAEYDKLVKSYLDGILTNYKTKYLDEITSTGAWKGFDKAAWGQMKDMIARDFSKGRDISQDKFVEQLKQEQMQKELQNFNSIAGSILNRLFGFFKTDTVPDNINAMLKKAFKTPDIVSSGNQLNIAVSPSVAAEGDQIILEVELDTGVSTEIQITITNDGTGAESTSRAFLDGFGKLSIPILNISVGNKEEWSGENTVTVEVEIPGAQGMERLTSTARFTVIDYKLTVTIEPYVVLQDDEITVDIQITPAVAAEIEFGGVRFPEPTEPFKTDDGGRLKATLSTKGVDLGWNNTLWTTARIPRGDNVITLTDIQVFYSVEPFVSLYISGRLYNSGDIVDAVIRTFFVPGIATKLEITIINEAGYRQSFISYVGEDTRGEITISLLELDFTNLDLWAGENTVTIIATLPSGKKTITAEASQIFNVVQP